MTLPYPITVQDVRPDGHNSFSVLPKLGPGDLDKLQSFYKFTIRTEYGFDRARPGQYFWGIAAFELKAGPAILQPQVRDVSGNLILTPPGILLCLSWPGAETFPATVDPPYSNRGVLSFTEGKGSVGWGFGPDSHIGENGGPFLCWATSDPADWPPATRRVGSDAVDRLGWWDDHIIPNPIFQVMKKAGSTPPPTGADYLVNVAADGTVTGHIALTPGAPPAGSPGGLCLMRGGEIVGYVEWMKP